MIQRVQTLFLFFAAVALALLFKFPFAVSDKATSTFLADKVYNIQDNPVLMVLAALGAALALAALFTFKNRALQMRLGYGLIVMCILLMIFSGVLFLNDSKTMAKTVEINDQLGLYLPIGALILGFLANRFIKKDDNKVKSMDRLR